MRLHPLLLVVAVLAVSPGCKRKPTYSDSQGPELAQSEIDRLYGEGQDKYDAGDFASASETWVRILDNTREVRPRKATREMLLLSVLQADIDAYNRTPLGDGTKNVEYLRSAKKALDTYTTLYHRAYGELAALGPAVLEKSAELDKLLAAAEGG